MSRTTVELSPLRRTTTIIDDLSLPPQSSSSISYSRHNPRMNDSNDDLGTPAARLRALLNRAPGQNNSTSASSSKLVSSSMYDDDHESNADSERASSVAQDSVRDLFRSLRDTPEKSRTPRRRSSINFGAEEDSPVKGKGTVKSSYSDDGVSMDMTSLANYAPAATSTPSSHSNSRRFTAHTWSQSQSLSHFNLAAGSRSNLLDLDSSMQRAMLSDSVSFGDESLARETKELDQKTPRASARAPLKDSFTPLPPPPIPSNNLHRSLHRRNRLEDDRRSTSSASSSSKSVNREEPSETEPKRTPSPFQSSRFATTPAADRPLTPSTIKQEMPRPTTPSTLPPTGQPAASRSPSMTPSVTKLPPRPRTSLTVSLIEDDERRLRKAISVPLPASSPPPFASPDRSPQRSPLPSPVLSAMPPSAINTRGTSPQIPLQSVETHASPKTSRSSMPSLSYTPVPIARNLPQRSPSPTRSSVVKPFIPRATPQTPSALSTPGSMRRRSFSPRIRSPSPSFELDNSTLPSLPSSSDGSDVEIELPQQPQTGSEVVLVSAFSDDSTEPEPIISIGSQEPSFSSALHSSFRSQPREEASSEMFDSLPVNTHPTTPRGVPRTPLPPVTPAPPGAFIFPGNTPARPGHSRAKGSRSTSGEEHEPATENTNVYAHLRTPAPPGAFNASRYPNTPKPNDTTTEEDAGDVLPAATPFRNMNTPKPPGGWAPTPSIYGTNNARRGRFSVRFDDTVDEQPARVQKKIQLPRFENSRTEEDQTMGQDTPFSPNRSHCFIPKEEEESGQDLPPVTLDVDVKTESPSPSTPRRKSRHKRNSSIRMVDAFGNEESSSPPSSPSKPKQKKRAKINMLDSLGREVVVRCSSASSSEGAEDREWDEMFRRDGESTSAVEASSSAVTKRDAARRLKWGLGNLVNDLQELDLTSSSDSPDDTRLGDLLRASEQARLARKKAESELQQVVQSQPRPRLLPDSSRRSDFQITKKVVFGFVVLQIVLFLLMLRYSNVRARALFLKQYYDLFYGDIHLFTSHYREQYLSSLSSILPSATSIPASNTTSGTSSSLISSLMNPFSSITLNPFKSTLLFGGQHGDSVGRVTDFGPLSLLESALRPVINLLGASHQVGEVDVSSWPPR